MFKINRKIEYALIALKHMHSKDSGQLTSAKEVCTIYSTPFDPTSRVMQMMTQNGILWAEQGAKGGYKLRQDLSQLSLLELSRILIGPIEIANCFQGEDSNCDIICSCKIIAPMLKLNDNINELFSKMMVADLLNSSHTNEKTIRNKKILETSKP